MEVSSSVSAFALGIGNVLAIGRIHGGFAVDRLQIPLIIERNWMVELKLRLIFLAGHAAAPATCATRYDSLPNAFAVLSSA